MHFTISLEESEKFSRIFKGVQCFTCGITEYVQIETKKDITDYDVPLRRLGKCKSFGHRIIDYLNGLEAW